MSVRLVTVATFIPAKYAAIAPSILASMIGGQKVDKSLTQMSNKKGMTYHSFLIFRYGSRVILY